MTAPPQSSLADTVRRLNQGATLNPASTAPSVRTMRVTTPAHAGQVSEASCGSVDKEVNLILKIRRQMSRQGGETEGKEKEI